MTMAKKENIFINGLFGDKLIRRNFKSCLLLISLSLLLIVFRFRNLPPQVPLFYSRVWGEGQLANKFWLFLLPLFSLIVLLLNSLLAIKNKDEVMIVRLLIAQTLFYSLLSLIILIKIITLMT